MQLAQWQEEAVQQQLQKLGARGRLLAELTDHWCVLISLEMNSDASFETALQQVAGQQNERTRALIAEIEELRFPYTISPVLVRNIGIVAMGLFATGIVLRVTHLFKPAGLLLPGYFLTAFVFLPLWFLRKLHTHADKVNSTLLFLTLLSATNCTALWLNHAPSRWIALGCCLLFVCFWLWNRYWNRRARPIGTTDTAAQDSAVQ
jgi:hypothetical protein